MNRFILLPLMSLTLFIAACSAGTMLDELVTESIVIPTEGAASDETAVDEISSDNMEEAVRPAWQTMPLVDARTGETFTLADFSGKTIFIEPMATWCSNCRAQLIRLKDVYNTLSADDYAFIALSVETNLSAETLASYADAEGFPWTFAVLSPEMLAELVREFGGSVSSPPSTPHFIVRPDGTFTELTTGAQSADAIIQKLQAESGM